MKRQRGRSRRSNNNSNPNRSMESNGPDVKVRGSAKQIFDKYETLARDAAGGGSRVKAENYRQHAEHYLRIVNEMERAKQAAQDARENEKTDRNDDGGDDNKKKSYSKSKDEKPKKKSKDSSDKTSVPASLEVVQTDAEKPLPTKSDAEPKSTRRRKAPSRKKDEDVVEAAE